jgi:hypothetical protein
MSEFRGRLELRMSLLDLVQFVSISGKEGKLLVRCGGETGTLFFRNGKLLHAETGNTQGADAFYKVAVWDGGDFFFAEVSVDCPKTITEGLSSLLLEAAHLQDEKRIAQSEKSEEGGANLQMTPLRLAYLKYVELSEAKEGEKAQNEADNVTIPPKKKTNWLLVLGGILLLFILIFWIFFGGFKN